MIAPSANRGAWNKLITAGVSSPGTVALSGHARTIGWDVKDAQGQAGATTSRKGEPIGKFDAVFYLTDEIDALGNSDFTEWDAYEALLMSSVQGTTPLALEVVHPDLNRLGYTAVVLAAMGELVHDGKGGATIKTSFLEYRPPQPKKTGGAGSTKTGTGEDWGPPAPGAIETMVGDFVDSVGDYFN